MNFRYSFCQAVTSTACFSFCSGSMLKGMTLSLASKVQALRLRVETLVLALALRFWA